MGQRWIQESRNIEKIRPGIEGWDASPLLQHRTIKADRAIHTFEAGFLDPARDAGLVEAAREAGFALEAGFVAFALEAGLAAALELGGLLEALA